MSGSILIVDDSLTVRMDLSEALEAEGLACTPCATIAAAREALGQQSVALAILDVLLPDGDGVRFLEEIRGDARTASLPVLMLSSEAEVKDRIRGLTLGANEYVGKPYDRAYVVGRVRELLQRVRAPAGDRKPTILVVDDSTTFREELRRSLEEAGYATIAATNGEDGLRVASANRPSAIIVDGVLPGIDGATVIRRVRLDAALRGTPCVLLTASEDSGAELRALDAGADAFVRKDDELEVVLARLAAVMRSAVSPTSARADSLLGPKKILAVDDSMTYLAGLAATLRHEGYDVILAHSGEEAIEMLLVQSVDCILLDVVMPGIGGQEACRRIKKMKDVRDIPLIMMTAIENREALIDALSIGADDYIPKSSEFEVLKARVRAQIRRKQFEDENRRIREELLRKELEAAEARAAREVAEIRAAFVDELERKNRELEAFSYSVSHDLRAPLRSIDGFSQALLEDYAEVLDEQGRKHLDRVRAAARRMGELIDDLLQLAWVSRAELSRTRVNLSEIALLVGETLRKADPSRTVQIRVAEGMMADADSRLIRVVFDNLIGNAWKFTSKVAEPQIAVGTEMSEHGLAYFVRDNGAGFNMASVEKLFRPFQRLHAESDFPGTGIGLATVNRIVDRHGGRAWATSEVGRGATFFFTLTRPRPGGRP